MREYTFEVWLDGEDGPLVARVDQRDIRRWEAKEGRSWLSEDLTVTAMTQVAWHALRRASQFTGEWDQFDGLCAWVREVGDAEPADPTRPAPTAAA